eukprot:COSAG06_NODE_54224_length_295_cov_1.836735_1_plen_50_part_01
MADGSYEVLASGADPPTPGGSDPEWATPGGTVEAWLAGVDLADYAAKIDD